MDPDVLSVPADMAERVAYQTGSVVSRTLLKMGSGSLTLFAFDEGQGLSEHTTPHVAVVLILDGSARVTIAEREMLVGKGEAVSLPAGVQHRSEERR